MSKKLSKIIKKKKLKKRFKFAQKKSCIVWIKHRFYSFDATIFGHKPELLVSNRLWANTSYTTSKNL